MFLFPAMIRRPFKDPHRPCRGRKLRSLAGLLAVGWLISIVLFNSACVRQTSPAKDGRLHILTSFLPMYIFTANLVRNIDGIDLENMAAPETGCLHDYRLLPKDMIKLESADLFIINGAGMEGFLTELAQQRSDLPLVEASTGIELLKDDNGIGNPHIWLSIRLAIRQVQNISRGLQLADPSHASQYLANEAAYTAKLQVLEEQFRTGLAAVTHKDIITFHEAFPYLASEYGLTVAAVIEREPGSEPTAAELADAVDLIRARQIKALFAEPQYPRKVAETIALETGATVRILDPVVTGIPAPDTYEKAMAVNLQVLIEALR